MSESDRAGVESAGAAAAGSAAMADAGSAGAGSGAGAGSAGAPAAADAASPADPDAATGIPARDNAPTRTTETAPETNLRDPAKRVLVVTTAALPWRTGTAVNAIARALHLAKPRPRGHVALSVPWLANPEHQRRLFGESRVFRTQSDQERWIRQYCNETMGCTPDQVAKLRIVFYASVYNESFGSIFPTQDISSLFAPHQAHIVILEEPEHLNWFRVPLQHDDIAQEDRDRHDTPTQSSPSSPSSTSESSAKTDTASAPPAETDRLGWAAKFPYVVGVLHTNYGAYVKQYGYGASIVASAAVDTLSAMVTRAYCHRIIRLSQTLPSFHSVKEVTSNVHGVRNEFMNYSAAMSETTVDQDQSAQLAPSTSIYFIGKVIWAKGFAELLELQERYRERMGEYFPIHIYGDGKDRPAIERAFFGRIPQSKRTKANDSNAQTQTPRDRLAAAVFQVPSIRSKLTEGTDPTTTTELLSSSANDKQPKKVSHHISTLTEDEIKAYPLTVARESWESSVACAATTATAVKQIVTDFVESGKQIGFSAVTAPSGAEDTESIRSLIFDPPSSMFELRQDAVPATFRGVRDHATLRNATDHKIFLNMSESEVLCTTTAEALAMGKFVIVPRHPSNLFFEQFPNCLMFTSHDEAIEYINRALVHTPEPLSDEHRRILSWQGAMDRLYEACILSKDSYKECLHADESLARLHTETIAKGAVLKRVFC